MAQAAGSGRANHRPTFVDRLLQTRFAAATISRMPVPLWMVRFVLARDNELENRKNSWDRLRSVEEAARYAAVRATTERYARHGFVLDIGCSQGILQESLTYGRYVGVDIFRDSIELAVGKSDDRTSFVHADGATYMPDQPPDAVVINEAIYYLRDPLGTIAHHAGLLATDGVIVLSMYARAWGTRRLLRKVAARYEMVESSLVQSGHLAWTVAVFRPPRAQRGLDD